MVHTFNDRANVSALLSFLEADTIPEDSMDPYGLSPGSHPADKDSYSPIKSPLSGEDSAGQSPDYDDFWRLPSASLSPGKTQHPAWPSSFRLYNDVLLYHNKTNIHLP